MAKKLHKSAHKYQFIIASTGHIQVWSCGLPDCTHYLPNHMAHMIEGRKSICWKCDKEFILDSESLKVFSEFREKVIEPICPSCRFTKRTGRELDADKLADFLETLNLGD